MHVFAWACTDVGQKRSENQDRFLIAHDLKLLAVADGMGGHNGGEVASRLAVETIEHHLRAAACPADGEGLAQAVRAANDRIHAAARADPALWHMGTTTSAVWVSGHDAFIAHVGDSRVYLVRDGRITMVTEDHSVVFQQLKAGLITPEQAKLSPYRNVILRSVGVEPLLDVDVLQVPLKSGDVLVLCSDGLTGLVTDEEIGAVVRDNFVFVAPRLLVDLANARGGHDNITVVVACALDDHDAASVAPAALGLPVSSRGTS